MSYPSRPRPDQHNGPPGPSKKDVTGRTYGMRHEEAALFSQLMVQAAGDRMLVIALTLWSWVKGQEWQVTKAWHDGASRCTQANAAEAFGVDERTIRRYFAVAGRLGLIRHVGWRPTRSGRVGLWKAEGLPSSVTSLRDMLASPANKRVPACPVNDRPQFEFDAVRPTGQGSSSSLSGQGDVSPLHPSSHLTRQGGHRVAVADLDVNWEGNDEDDEGRDWDDGLHRQEEDESEVTPDLTDADREAAVGDLPREDEWTDGELIEMARLAFGLGGSAFRVVEDVA